MLITPLFPGSRIRGAQGNQPEAAEAVRDWCAQSGYIDASRANDTVWFDRHMAEDAVVVLSSGRPALEIDADAHWQLSDGREGISRYMDAYLWLNGHGKVISAQITSLPVPSARE